MFCPKCGKTVKPTARFCPECGARLSSAEVSTERERRCQNCGAVACGKFCGECGAELSASAEPPVPTPVKTPQKKRRRGLPAAIAIAVATVIVVAVVTVVAVNSQSSYYVYDRDTLNGIKLGMTEAEISGSLGASPDLISDNVRMWYGRNAEEREDGALYETLLVRFGADGGAEFVFYDTEHYYDRYDAGNLYSTSTNSVRTVGLDFSVFEAIEVDGKKHVSSSVIGAEYIAEFDNDSFVKGFIDRSAYFYVHDDSATAGWSDEVSSYSFTCALTPVATVTGGVLGRYSGTARACNVPSGVTEIAADAFAGNTALETLVLPDTLERIGANAFGLCAALKNINFPSNLDDIASNAFIGCSALETVRYESTDFELDSALRGLSGLNIIFDGEYTEIPRSAFDGCKSVARVSFGPRVSSIGASAFYGCLALEDVSYSGEIKTVGDYAFRNTSWFASQTGLIYLDDALVGCNGELEEITVRHGTQYVPYGCFAWQPVSRVELPDTLERIGGHAFENCRALEYVEIPSGVTAIGDSAFAGCAALEKCLITASVEEIGENAFFGCAKLAEIFIAADTFPSKLVDALINTGHGDVTVVYAPDFEYDADGVPVRPWECDGATLVKYNGFKPEPVLPSGVTTVGAHAFYGNIFIERITLPDGVTELGDGAFGGCENLEAINVPLALETIGKGAFDGCEKLHELVWAADVWNMDGGLKELKNLDALDIRFVGTYTEIPDYAFRELTNIRSVSFPASVEKLGVGVFAGCYELENVEFAGHVTEARSSAFGWTRWLSNRPSGAVYIGDALIAYNAKNNIASEAVLSIKDGVKFIPWYCFSNVRGLETVIMPDSVVELGCYAFDGCADLKTVKLSAQLDMIPYRAFSNCVSLEQIMGTGGIKKIEDYAFSGCAALTDFGIGAETLGQGCFTACTALASVSINANVKKVGANVFTGCTALETITIDRAAVRDDWHADWLGDCKAKVEIN